MLVSNALNIEVFCEEKNTQLSLKAGGWVGPVKNQFTWFVITGVYVAHLGLPEHTWAHHLSTP